MVFNALGNLIGQVLIPAREAGYMLSTTTMAIVPGTNDLLIGASDFAGRGAFVLMAKTFAGSWDRAYQLQKR
jgi:lactonase